MKKTLPLSLLMFVLAISACAPQSVLTPAPLPVTVPVATHTPTAIPPTPTAPPVNQKDYTNSVFGLSFQYPSGWFGPDEYVSGQNLRVAVGSNVVYPYGTQPEQPSAVKNSYLIVIQYSKNNQNSYWEDTYQSLLNLKNGESFSSPRSLVTRVREINYGTFAGFEYITTLPETAQTEPVYIREVMLFDKQSNDLLTIMGTPNNVEVSAGTDWRNVYQMVDEANLDVFHELVASLTLK